MFVQSREDKRLIKLVEARGETVSAKGAVYKYCGPLIAKGLNRDVYEFKHSPDYVVKIQRTQNFDNMLEWKIWEAVAYNDNLHKWFAPCLIINEIGTVLIQRKADQTRLRKEYPKHLPAYFTDFKYANYGFIGDNFVCVDYSSCLMLFTNFLTDKTRYVKWWKHSGRKVDGLRKKIKISQNL